MHTDTKYKIMLVFVTLLLASCNPVNKADKDIFGNPNCIPPCWNSFVPGISTKDEIIRNLKDLEITGEGELNIYTENNFGWNALSGKSYLFTIGDESTLSRMQISRFEETTLGGIVEILGEPDGLSLYSLTGPTFMVIYPEQGAIFTVYPKSKASNFGDGNFNIEIPIKPDIKLWEVSFVRPGTRTEMLQYLYKSEDIAIKLDTYIEWQGYDQVILFSKDGMHIEE